MRSKRAKGREFMNSEWLVDHEQLGPSAACGTSQRSLIQVGEEFKTSSQPSQVRGTQGCYIHYTGLDYAPTHVAGLSEDGGE